MEAHIIQILGDRFHILALYVLQGVAIHVPAKEVAELFTEQRRSPVEIVELL